MRHPGIQFDYPSWVTRMLDWERRYESDEDKMRLAIDVARRNVLEDTGGPFGAAIFEQAGGRLVSVGMNVVVPQNNCILHGEIVAFMMAQARLGTYRLAGPDMPAHEMATSCDPCAMCLGATLWSGVRRVICGAHREDAEQMQFDEGPVFPESYAYLERRGIEFKKGVCRQEAADVLDLYVRRNGIVYNG
jgi:tRNA(Arg) A34 adenosine deaminase TadA